MSGYVPVFDSVFQGTLCGRWPDTGVWLCLLALADKHGHIDITVPYIAAVTGIPAEVLTDCISRFTSPDPNSRTKDEEGRRLVLLDATREWGWKVVNHAKYREKARKQSHDQKRTDSGQNIERMRERRETRDDPTGPAITRSQTQTQTHKREGAKSASRRVPEAFSPDLEYALTLLPDIDATAEAQKFRDHEFKKSRSDWNAVWRTWIRTCKDSGRYSRKEQTKWQ
jgi:hypothetical protein